MEENWNFFIGSHRKLFWGHTKDNKIREKASGGGIVSDILISALKKKLIDGAIVTKMNPKTLKAEPLIAKTPKDILDAAGSKYIIAPNLSILETLKKGKYAFVGLPCQVQALRNMQAKEIAWAKKVKYVIGLFCGSSMDNDVINYLLKKLKVKNDISDIQFRSRDNPKASSFGGFLVESKTGKKYLDKEKYGFLRHLFMNNACKICDNQTNELADISVGDFWLKRKFDEKLPSSMIVRTKAGEKLLKNSKTLNLNELNTNDLIDCEFELLLDKKIRTLIRSKKVLDPAGKVETYNNQVLLTKNMHLKSLLFFESLWLRLLNLRKSKLGRFLIYNLPLDFWKQTISLLYKIHNSYLRRKLLVTK